MEDIKFQATEQNLYSNWFRNGLMTSLLALTLFQNLQHDKNHGFIKMMTISFLIIAIMIFTINLIFSKSTTKNIKTFHDGIYYNFSYIIIALLSVITLYILYKL